MTLESSRLHPGHEPRVAGHSRSTLVATLIGLGVAFAVLFPLTFVFDALLESPASNVATSLASVLVGGYVGGRWRRGSSRHYVVVGASVLALWMVVGFLILRFVPLEDWLLGAARGLDESGPAAALPRVIGDEEVKLIWAGTLASEGGATVKSALVGDAQRLAGETLADVDAALATNDDPIGEGAMVVLAVQIDGRQAQGWVKLLTRQVEEAAPWRGAPFMWRTIAGRQVQWRAISGTAWQVAYPTSDIVIFMSADDRAGTPEDLTAWLPSP